jgi:hypothetical protein
MSMSTYVSGLIPAVDPKFQQMFDIQQACDRAKVQAPQEVINYFAGKDINEKGQMVIGLRQHACCTKIDEDSMDGFIVDVTLLPTGVRYIRFENSY